MNDGGKIMLVNYKGEDYTVYFENYEIAKKNFDRLHELNKDMPEFNFDDSNEMSWSDSQYNEYNTFVYLLHGAPKIYNEIIF